MNFEIELSCNLIAMIHCLKFYVRRVTVMYVFSVSFMTVFIVQVLCIKSGLKYG